MPELLPFYHEKEDKLQVSDLTDKEIYDRDSDWEDIKNQREYRDKKIDKWRWSGSVYNIVQNANFDDRVSNIVLGWIRSYIDTGIAQMTAGEPEFDYEALGPSDDSRTLLWKQLVQTAMDRSNFGSHQNIAITDSHVFGPGVFEVFQQRPYRTIRVPKGDTFEEKVIVDHRIPKVGVRAISPFRCTRNPNVSDPNEVGSCTKEEILSWNQFVQKYGRCLNHEGKRKYKNIDKVPKGSHVKITVYQDEIRDILRLYALSYGNKNDGESDTPPEDIGIPIFDRPLKIHDVYDAKGKLLRSMGLNLPGMCSLVFLPYADKLNDDFETHCLYGMGLPEHMEGLDTFMQTAFNMTVDNFRLGNTVVLDYESKDGTVPDFDANTYYGGEFVNAKVTSTTLGQDRTKNFDQMYEVLQKMAIPGTGININQISGDTSRTAFEFAQRIEANNKRSEMRLKEWEAGPFKRLGTLLLSGSISELTIHDLEQVKEKDYKKILGDIEAGRATREDYKFENGKPVEKKSHSYIDMKGYRESFDKTRKSRRLDPDSTENTLVKDTKNPDAVHKIPVTEEYVFPDWYAESGVLFDTKVSSKRMLTNKKIRDIQSIQAIINHFLTLVQVDPMLAQRVDVPKFFGEILKFAEFDDDKIMKQAETSEEDKILTQLRSVKESILTPPQNAMAPQPSPVPAQANTSQLAALAGAGGQSPLSV